MRNSCKGGISFREIVIILALIAILVGLSLPSIGYGLTKGTEMGSLSNMRQVQIATESAALDRETSGETNIIGWPGTNGFSVWVTNMATNANLTTNDLKKLFSAPGVTLKGLPQYAMGRTAFRVYQVSSNSSPNTVFISTFNWNAQTPSVPLSSKSVPYGDKRFVIMHKGGDGTIFSARQISRVTNTNLFGIFTNNVAP